MPVFWKWDKININIVLLLLLLIQTLFAYLEIFGGRGRGVRVCLVD